MTTTKKPIDESLKEYGRGITGGLLFSLPMLYTMELWWAGFIANPLQLIIYFIVGFSLLMVYNHYVGIRREHSIWEGFMESAEELGMGILLTIFILWITGRIAPNMSLNEISGKIVVEAITMAIGISVGKSQLGGDNNDTKEKDTNEEESKNNTRNPHLVRSIGIALCGAILIASNVAPTDEVMVIAVEANVYKLFIISLLSIGIGGAVLYYLNFKGAKSLVLQPQNHWDAVLGTVIMYAIALSSSAFMLWFFGRFGGLSLYGMIAETIVLAFPAALGASAGRLLIQV
ncbi:TIGR02587 family membrane protein [Aequorivita capsosiphonis]|uniref:TIGR02587 family membrane protein n=1 Tax=Aequorivita capsosiphonis TaxID=487317 RepID=UPI000688F802|nr:TIGR02587 family membrane protein [Aequorivita capsosiphonis]